MPERRYQDIWKEQCQAARGVRQRHGVVSALDYLIGEKLLDYAEMAVTRPEFARELPSFVAEIRSIFSADEIRTCLEHLDRMRRLDNEALSAEPSGDDASIETPAERAAAAERFRRLKELLTSTVLGTA
jgi:phosphopantothenate synthetase